MQNDIRSQKEHPMLRFGSSHLIVIGVMAFSTTTGAQDTAVVHAVAETDSALLLITKIYDITLLTTERQHFPFHDSSPNGFARIVQFQQGSGGHGGGGGGFGGGGGGGGGGGVVAVVVADSSVWQMTQVNPWSYL